MRAMHIPTKRSKGHSLPSLKVVTAALACVSLFAADQTFNDGKATRTVGEVVRKVIDAGYRGAGYR